MLPEIYEVDESNVVLVNEDLADKSAVGSTKDSGPRPLSWNPPLISKLDYEIENPYNK